MELCGTAFLNFLFFCFFFNNPSPIEQISPLCLRLRSCIITMLQRHLIPLGSKDCSFPFRCLWAHFFAIVDDFFFPASRGPFSFVFAELTGGTKRDLCHGSKWTVLSMRHSYLATETPRDAFSTWSADDSHLSQLARQKTPAQFCCREWRVHQNPKRSRQFV